MVTEASPDRVIQIERVTKVYDGRPAVTDISFNVTAGQVCGMIGPSGSGKTTMVLLMVGVRVPSAGSVRVLGHPPDRFPTTIKERIGYMPQGSFLYPNLTTQENLSHAASLYGLGWLRRRRAIRPLLQELGLWEARHRRAGNLSGGMLRHLQLATVLVHGPHLAFIDEPMEGLDPLLRQEVWGILDRMRARGQTVLMTTHNMSEAERCDSLVLMMGGRLLATGRPRDLRQMAFGGDVVRLLVGQATSAAYSALESLPGILQVDVFHGREVRLVARDGEAALNEAAQALRRLGVTVNQAEVYQPPFDEVFERLVRRD